MRRMEAIPSKLKSFMNKETLCEMQSVFYYLPKCVVCDSIRKSIKISRKSRENLAKNLVNHSGKYPATTKNRIDTLDSDFLKYKKSRENLAKISALSKSNDFV